MNLETGLFTMMDQLNEYKLHHRDYGTVLMYTCELLARHAACGIPITDELIKDCCNEGLKYLERLISQIEGSYKWYDEEGKEK